MPHLTLLGGALLEDRKGSVTGPATRRHPLALMALLATGPSQTRSRSKLVGLLWPGAPEQTARGRLNTCVHRVRSGLGAESVESLGDDLRLDLDVVGCDVPEFEVALEAGETEHAVDLYVGPFLDGFRLKGSPAFEKWTDGERRRLARDYRRALESLAERAEKRNELGEAIRWWRELVREDPYDSRTVLRLMKTLRAAGTPARALRVARRHGKLLEEELGSTPSAEVRKLTARLERGDRASPSPSADAARASSAANAEYDEQPAGRAQVRAEEKVSGGRTERSDGAVSARPDSQYGSDRTDAPGGSGREADGDRRSGPSSIGRGAVVGGVLLLLAGVAGAWQVITSGGVSPPRDSDPSIAVVPFETIGDPGGSVLAKGMRGDLLTRLAHVSGLKVIAATSVDHYRAADLPLAAIADSLGAQWLVEASVQRLDDEIQVNAQLVDPRTGTHAWAESYRRSLDAASLFDLQGDITRRIVASLEARLTLSEERRVARQPTGSLSAYRSYIQGRLHLEERTDAGTRRAAEHFDRALEQDSSFALAWAGLADVAIHREEYGHGPLPDSLRMDAERAVRKALSLDSTLAEAHATLGYLHRYRGDGVASLRELERAVELKPNYAQAHTWLGMTLGVLGRVDRAITHLERGVELDPLSPVLRVPLGGFYSFDGRLELSLKQLRQAQELAPDFALSHLAEGQTLSIMGRQREALEAYERGRKLASENSLYPRLLRAWRAVAHARRGDLARARLMLSSYPDTPAGSYDRAVVHAALGEQRAALTALGKARPMDHYLRIVMLRHAPVFDSLREEVAFEELLREVNRGLGLRPDGSLPAES